MAVIFNPFTGKFDFTGASPPIFDLDASTNPLYPAAAKGTRYRITVAGKVGGIAGKIVEAGDTIEALVSNAGGTEAAVGTDWFAMQANIAGITAAGLAMIQAADVSAQRTLLGLGTMALQNAAAVAITGGTLAGLTGLAIRSSGAAFDLTLATAEVLTAARTLSFNVGDANRAVTIPATGTVALLGTPNVFTSLQTSNAAMELGIVASAFASTNKIRLSAFDNNTLEMTSASGKMQFIAAGFGAISGSISWFDMAVPFGLTNGTGGSNRTWLINRASDHLGLGTASATPVTQTFGGAQGSGTNITGGTLNIGTRGTGTGTGGVINFQTHAAGSSSSTLQTLVTVMQITSAALITISAGVGLKLGNAAVSEVVVPDKTITFIDSTGQVLRIPCLI